MECNIIAFFTVKKSIFVFTASAKDKKTPPDEIVFKNL